MAKELSGLIGPQQHSGIIQDKQTHNPWEKGLPTFMYQDNCTIYISYLRT